MKQIPVALLTLVAGIVVTLVSFWVGQNHGLLPEQVSEQAPLVDGFFNVMMTIGTALFLVVEGAILLFVVMFRKRKGDEADGEPLEGNIPLEIFWTAIPAIIVIGLGIYSVEVYSEMGGFDPAGHGSMMAHHHSAPHSLQASAIAAPMSSDDSMETSVVSANYGFGATPEMGTTPPDLVVNVTGLQYAWIFNYPDSNVISGELHIPVGKDVQLNLSAQDVIHSFWVPQFRLKQDAIPGQDTTLRFVATKTGDYPIVCTELCGSYHGSMRSRVIIHSEDEFADWVTQNQIAQQNGAVPTVAVNPTELTEAEFIAPYGEEMGIHAETLAQLQSGA